MYPPFLRKLFENLYQKNGIKQKIYKINKLALGRNNHDTKMKALKQIWRKIIRDQKINMIKINDEVENFWQICRNKKSIKWKF